MTLPHLYPWFRQVILAINRSLFARLLLLIAPILLILAVSLTTLLSMAVSQFVRDYYEKELMRQAEILELSLQHGFITKDMANIQDMIQNIGQESQVVSLRLLNKDGVILGSSAPDEIDVQLTTENEYCVQCHTSAGSPIPTIKLTSSVDGMQKVMSIANRLENRPACQKCHEGSVNTLGILLMESSIEPLQSWYRGIDWAMIAGAALVVIAGITFTMIAIRRVVNDPLRDLAKGAKIRDERVDDIGILAARMSHLEEELDRSQEEISKRTKDLDALLTISEATGGTLSLGQVLQQVLDTVLQVAGFSTGDMRLLDNGEKCFRLVSHRGMSPRVIQEILYIPQEAGFQGEVARTLRPVFTMDLASDPRTRSPGAIEEGFQSLVCVPLLAGDQLVGIMEIATKEKREWDQDELRWFAVVGHQIGIVVNRIQLSEQTRDKAVLEERGRLSQEIHDGLSQLVGSLHVRAEDALLSLEAKDWAKVRRGVESIEQSARDAYASLREEMLGLRDTIVSGQGLVPLLKEFLSRFYRQWGIEAMLLAENEHPYFATPAVEIQLLRVVQEAITNVRRHANASRVIVRLEQDDDRLRVSVEDDGQGFDTRGMREESRLGLRIISERAASVGGKLSIDSSPGGGTIVEIEVPRNPLHMKADG